MSNSYRTVIERLKLFAEGHFLIRKFYHEELPSNDIGKFPEYPMMLVLPVQITPSAGVLDYQFEIIFADLPRDKADENEYHKEIISDCTRLALDLLAEIENNQVLFGQDAEIDGKTATITPFIKEYTHSLDGVQLNFTLRLPYDWSACDIPADYSPNTTDNPTTGGGIVTKIAIYSDGEFVGYANQINFNTDFNVTFANGRATIDVAGGGGGGLTCEDLADCALIVDIQSDISTLQNQLNNLAFIPLAGTEVGSPVTGNIEVTGGVEVFVENSARASILWDDGTVEIRARDLGLTTLTSISVNDTTILAASDVPTFAGIVYNADYSANFNNLSLINQLVMKSRIWTKAGTPTTSDDSAQGYLVGSLIWDTTNSILYRCTSNTAGAAIWTSVILGGTVDSVTGNIVNNTDPANPVVTQVQADWNSSSGLSQILNKPTIPTSLPPSGSAGGDLTGTYPNPTVSKIHGIDVQNGTASDGQILKYHAAENKWKHHTQVKADVGLGNVDNTSDANKPVSTAQQTALNLKLNKADIWRTVLATDSASFSGTTSETIVRSVLIPAGTFNGDWNILVRARLRKTGTVGSTGMRIRVNTSNSLTGANLLGWLSAGTSNIYLQMKRDVVVKGANSEVFSITSSSATDDLNANVAVSSVAIDWTVDQYLLVTITPTSTGDSYINSFFLIEGRKTLA